MALDMNSTFAPIMKELYTPNEIQELVLTDRPGLAIAKRREDFYGSDAKQPTLYGNPQNRSADFSTALAQTSTSSASAFLVTTVKDYSFCSIDNRTIEASKNDKGAFTEALDYEIEGALNSLSNSMSRQFYRSGWGDIARIGNITGTTITLSLASSSFNFEKGMKIVFASTQASSVLRSGTSVTVNSVNRATGTITISAATGSPQNGDWIFCDGDRQNSATPTRVCMSGLDAWVPFGGVSPSESFFGVDRSVDSRLYGNSLDATGQNIEDALLSSLLLSSQNGGNPDFMLVNPVQYTALVRTLGSKVQYIDLDVDNVKVGFRGIQIQGPKQVVTVLQDIWCPGDRAYTVESKNILLHSTGPAPKMFDTDGIPYLRSNSQDGVDVRIYSYAQVRVLQPSHFVTTQLTPVG